MEKEHESNKECIRQYQIDRAIEYIKDKCPGNGSEPSLEWCIISDLLRMVKPI